MNSTTYLFLAFILVVNTNYTLQHIESNVMKVIVSISCLALIVLLLLEYIVAHGRKSKLDEGGNDEN